MAESKRTIRQTNPDRYARFTTAELDSAKQWLRDQGSTPWMSRFKIEGDYVHADTRGMPPVVRQMLFEWLSALEAMPRDRVREYLAGTAAERVALVDAELTGAGR